jgi:hypothetical protein
MTVFYDGKLPLGATSLELVDRIYLEQALEDEGALSLIPVLPTYASGMILEEQGHYKEAAKLYTAALKRHPRNPWIKDASERLQYLLN